MAKCKTHQRFLSEIAPFPVIPLDRYVAAKIKIRFLCTKHEVIWSATPDSIRRGTGCSQCGSEKITISKRRHNRILADHGEWLLIDISTKTYPDATMKIDKTEWAVIDSLGKVSSTPFGYSRIPGVAKFVHQVVMNSYGRSVDIDHINGDRSDNRRSNLRLCSRAENLQNRTDKVKGKSGTRGVYYHPLSRLWTARIGINGKQVSLKYYKTKEEAVQARRTAEAKHYGEFAPKLPRKKP